MIVLTAPAVYQAMRKGSLSIIQGWTDTLLELSQIYEISSALRMAHFGAQIAEETDGFRTLEEYASGSGYEDRSDLGNTVHGDGVRFKGRGYIMITGRYNYRYYGSEIGQDLENKPNLASIPNIAIQIAGAYWYDHYLNEYADADNILAITRKINGGLNGIVTRRYYLSIFKTLLGVQQ